MNALPFTRHPRCEQRFRRFWGLLFRGAGLLFLGAGAGGGAAAAKSDADVLLPIPALEAVKRREALRRARVAEEKRRMHLEDVRRLIALAAAKSAPNARILTLLRAERILTALRRERPETRVARLLAQVHRLMAAVPPPATFRNRLGMRFILAPAGAKGEPGIYALSAPVSAEVFRRFHSGALAPAPPMPGRRSPPAGAAAPAVAVDWRTAAAFAVWLSRQTGMHYMLPSRAEIERLPQPPGCALWTRSEWKGPDPEHYAMRRRFGITMFEIVVPGAAPGRRPAALPELPFARYRSLSFILVTPVSTGRLLRIIRLRGKLP